MATWNILCSLQFIPSVHLEMGEKAFGGVAPVPVGAFKK